MRKNLINTIKIVNYNNHYYNDNYYDYNNKS